MSGAPTHQSPAARPTGRQGPLTVAQQQLWELDRRTRLPGALNLSYALTIEGPLDTAALAGAFADLVRTHEPLRTTYHATADGPLAQVENETLGLRHVDLEPRDVPGIDAAAALARDARERGFDLAHEAPVRAMLLRLGAHRHVLLLTLHHIAADGWSLYVVNEHLSQGYAARLDGARPAPHPAPRAECLEQATRQRAWLAGTDAVQETTWWTAHLRGAEARPRPLDVPHDTTGTDMIRCAEPVPDELTAQLRKLGRSAGVSLYVIMLTAFNALLLRWADAAQPVVGTLAASRPTADSAEVMGAHYNPLLLNTGLKGDPSLAEALLHTSERAVRALDRQRLPYAALAPHLHHAYDWAPNSTPAAMFLMDRYPLEGLKLKGCDVTGLYLADRAAGARDGTATVLPAATTAGLSVFVREAAERLTVSALAPTGTTHATEVAALIRAYVELLYALCETPEVPLSQIELSLTDLTDLRGLRGPTDLTRPTGPTDLTQREVTLRQVTEFAPVEALSPVGVWAPLP